MVAPDFIPTVLGRKRDAAIPVVQVLCWVGLLQSLQRMNSSILAACDKTQALLRYSLIVLVASVAAFVGGLPWGVVGVATGYAISSSIVEPYYTYITLRALDMSVWTYLRSLRGVVEASVAMTAAVAGTRYVLVAQSVDPAARLVICIVVGGLVFIPLCAWRSPEILQEFDGIRRRIRRPRLPVAGVQPSEQ